MKIRKQNSVRIWDSVWEHDRYSDPSLRKLKARKKIDLLLNWLPGQIDGESVIIDAGCGGGYLTEYLSEKTNAVIKAFDQSPKAIEICKERKVCDKAEVICCDALKLPYASESADIIICVGLIEHIRKAESCIQELKRVLKTGGYLYVVSSNKHSAMWLQWLWRNLIRRWNYGYQKNWNPKKLGGFLEGQFFETIKLEAMEGIGNFSCITQIDGIARKWNKLFGRYIVYLGRKK